MAIIRTYIKGLFMSKEQASSHYNKSSDIFYINFGGENVINAQTFLKIMQDVIEISREVASSLEPNAFVRIDIKATGEGSFQTTLDAIIEYAPTIFTQDNLKLAKDLTSGILDIIKIKKHLKGEKPKDVLENNGTTTITNHENERLNVPSKIGNVYLRDSKIDNLTVNIFQTLEADIARNGFAINTSMEQLEISKSQYPQMVKSVIQTPEKVTIPQKQIVPVDLLLKKPDLLGDSKWEFIFNKKITVKIEDKEFLEKVHKGKIKLYAGIKIPCKLLIEYKLDEKYETLPETESYTILEVTGDAIEPDDNYDLFDS